MLFRIVSCFVLSCVLNTILGQNFFEFSFGSSINFIKTKGTLSDPFGFTPDFLYKGQTYSEILLGMELGIEKVVHCDNYNIEFGGMLGTGGFRFKSNEIYQNTGQSLSMRSYQGGLTSNFVYNIIENKNKTHLIDGIIGIQAIGTIYNHLRIKPEIYSGKAENISLFDCRLNGGIRLYPFSITDTKTSIDLLYYHGCIDISKLKEVQSYSRSLVIVINFVIKS
jgi:hypothetical protein